MSPTPPLIWFLLLDSATGKPYKGTSADYVVRSSLVVPVIDQFRDAVKAKHSNKLYSVDAADLVVYMNKAAFDKRNVQDGNKEEPLEEDSLIDGLGSSKKEALVVAVQASESSGVQRISLSDKLRQLGVEFTVNDLHHIVNHDMARLAILMSPNLTRDTAQPILTYAKSRIKSSTQRAIGLQHSIFLDGSLNAGQGQTKSSLYYVFSESGGVLVAKVYAGHKKDFMREVKMSEALNHPNLVKFIKTFSIQNDTRHIIIMPFFPRSVADMLGQSSPIPLPAIKVIARNCLDALCHLHSKGFCFADLKTSNIMLQNAQHGHTTLVDYGAAVRIGTPIIEFSRVFCLDADTITATEHLDSGLDVPRNNTSSDWGL